MTCPECGRPTIWRIGGEWCRSCRNWIWEVKLHHTEGRSLIRRLGRGPRY